MFYFYVFLMCPIFIHSINMSRLLHLFIMTNLMLPLHVINMSGRN